MLWLVESSPNTLLILRAVSDALVRQRNILEDCTDFQLIRGFTKYFPQNAIQKIIVNFKAWSKE